ncbi:MAG: hypothetical protein J6S89_00690 [Paludibacteraceae bacterium]|nr:hypothetical protein [Paludibacteraceae bacterium]
MASKLNKCNASYLEEMQKMESNFIASFNSVGYQSRTEAKQAYLAVAEEVYSKYRDALAEVYEQEAEMSKQYASDYKKKTQYDNALGTNIDQNLESKVVALTMATEIPESVMAKIRMVIPPKPDYLQIQEDLVGHSLSEGVEDGYYLSSWRWVIKEDEISDFNIESVQSDTPQDYLLVANMRLTSEVGKAFDAKVKIRYILPQNDDWTIEFVQSLGMHIVKTHMYDDCVKVEKDGWWYYIKNHCELALEVGGKELHYEGWRKFSHVVEPHGGYCMHNPDEIIVDYVERP